jgi:hypothetical protein
MRSRLVVLAAVASTILFPAAEQDRASPSLQIDGRKILLPQDPGLRFTAAEIVLARPDMPKQLSSSTVLGMYAPASAKEFEETEYFLVLMHRIRAPLGPRTLAELAGKMRTTSPSQVSPELRELVNKRTTERIRKQLPAAARDGNLRVETLSMELPNKLHTSPEVHALGGLGIYRFSFDSDSEVFCRPVYLLLVRLAPDRLILLAGFGPLGESEPSKQWLSSMISWANGFISANATK